jgi:hypothetical protein
MDFTLDQLSPETMTMIFGGAYYDAENNLFKPEDGEELAVSTLVRSNNRVFNVYGDVDHLCITYRLVLGLSAEQSSDRKKLLEVCNIYDDYAIHASIVDGNDENERLAFIYKHIVPTGVTIAPKELVGIFRVFEKTCFDHINAFNSLLETAT